MTSTSKRKCCVCEEREIDLTQGDGDDFVILLPCKCFACPKCSFRLCCNRKNETPACPRDKKQIDDVIHFEASRTVRMSGHPTSVEKFEANIEKEPGRVFLKEFKKNKTAMGDKLFLHLTYMSKEYDSADQPIIDSFSPATMISIIDSKHGFETEEDEENLRKIFGLLHFPIMAELEKETKHRKTFPRMTPAEFCDYCLEKDNSFLLKLIYALTTGKMSINSNLLRTGNRHDDALSNFLAACVAKGMIERANTRSPGPLQTMVADMLFMEGVPKYLREFMSKIRLSSGRRTTDRMILKDELKNKLKRIKLSQLGTFVLKLDNFGFKGRDARFVQHTIIQIGKIDEATLRQLGFYNENKISRVTKPLEELLEEETDEFTLAEGIVLPNDKDYQKLSHRIIDTIKYAATINIPSVEDCRDILSSDGAAVYPTEFASNLGVEIATVKQMGKENKVTLSDPVATNEIFETEDLEDEENDGVPAKKTVPKTFYDINSITLDHVLHGDPGTYKVIRKIVDYLEEATTIKDFDYDESGGELPVRGIIAAATADGSPVKRWLDYHTTDIQAEGSFENRKYKRSRFFFGGFHFMMEVLSMRGRLSRGFTSFFARKWRTAEPSMMWIYLIRDPNDALREWREYLLVHYKIAAEAAETTDPIDVHRYMIDRAVEIPTCMAVLLDLRLLEIVFMIRDSEKTGKLGDVPLFLTCLRFALPIFAITHAINYCHLVCDFLEWYKLASDAEKILFENFYYTVLSPEGKPIWTDRGVEWSVRHVRMFLGHRVRSDRIVQRVVSQIPFRIKAKKELRSMLGIDSDDSYTTADWNEQTFRLGKASLHTIIALKETNFYGPGPLTGDLECNSDDTMVLVDDDGYEHKVNSSFLGSYDLGIDRITSYYVQHHIRDRYTKTRSEKDNELKLIPTTHELQHKNKKTTLAARLSIKEEELMPLIRVFPKKKIVEELTHLRDFEFPEMRIFTETEDRPTLVKAVCLYRKRNFEINPHIYQETKECIVELTEKSIETTREKRLHQVTSLIYKLDLESYGL